MVTGFGVVTINWKHLTYFRNRYHTGRFHDTFIIICIIVAQSIGIVNLKECVRSSACGDHHEENSCVTNFGGTSFSMILQAIVSFFIAFVHKPNRVLNILEGFCLLIAAAPYFIGLVTLAPFAEEALWPYIIIASLLPIILPPLLISNMKIAEQHCEPLHVEYFNERCGLFVIVNIAVMVESAITDISSEFSSVHYCRDGSNHSSSHNNEQNMGSNLSIAPQFEAILYAIAVKCLYFNAYRPSVVAMQRSNRRYQIGPDISVICIYVLSIGLGMNSTAVQMVADTTLSSEALTLSIVGSTLLIIALSALHLNHTVKDGYLLEWTKKKLLLFVVARSVLIGAYIFCCAFFLKTNRSFDSLVFCFWTFVVVQIEQHVFELPVKFGKNRDLKADADKSIEHMEDLIYSSETAL